MGNKVDHARRLAGAFFLIVSALLLVAGETALRDWLKQNPVLALLYWGTCFIAVFLAIMVALLDLWIVRRRSHEETRGLLHQTLEQIAREKENHARQEKSGHE
ncbi:MAG TPA: hypothetical protein VK327_06110 [Candidatus Paceibacterota bacterium]|nr:hypothetical protein [Candidatus Paceibacterota bacterium]